MKTFTQIMFVFILIPLCGINHVFAQQWWTVGSPHFTGGASAYLSLAIDGNGTPYVAYDDVDFEWSKITVKKYYEGSWQVVGSPGFSTGANYITIAINGSGTPYVSYTTATTYTTNVMKYTGIGATGWEYVGSPEFSGMGAEDLSLAIDGSGIPYVLYVHGYIAIVKKFTGIGDTGWETVGSAGFTPDEASHPKIAIDRSGTPYVLYEYLNTLPYQAKVMKYTGNGVSGWDFLGTVGNNDNHVYSSLAIDGLGNPYVAYNDYENSGKKTVKKYYDGSWQVIGSPGFSAMPPSHHDKSIAIDGSGIPYVAYVDAVSCKPTVMKYSGSGTDWENLGASDLPVGGYFSIAIAPNGIPVVIYEDATDMDDPEYIHICRATVMKFSESADEPLYPPTVQTSNITFSNILYNSFTINWTNGNGSRRAIFVKQAGSGTTTPTDYTTYTASTTFGNGTEIGSGWYCVYNGTGTSVTVSGLSASTDYIAQVFEYSGQTYLTTTEADNPKTTTTAAQTNYALQFASGKYASTSSPSNTIADLTLECRFNYSGYPGYEQGIIYNGSGNGYGIYIRGSGDCAAQILMGGVAWSGQFYALPQGTWTHLALVHTSGGEWTLYVNGVSRVVMSNTPIVPSSQFSVGTNFNGQIDEVRFSNVARYTSNFTPPILPFTPDVNTLALYHFDEGTGTASYDASANGYNLTLSGSPAWVDGDPALPVELTNFTATAENNKVMLKWKTATEVNNYGFEIQRSEVGSQGSDNPQFEIRNPQWELVGFVEGAGNSNSPKEYSFTDAQTSEVFRNLGGFYTLQYRLKQIDTDGKFTYSNEIEVNVKFIPTEFTLEQNYPNPFNPVTNFEFRIPNFGFVGIKIYDILGNEVTTLVNEEKEPGYYTIQWNADKLASGVYFYMMHAKANDGGKDFRAVKKMLMIK